MILSFKTKINEKPTYFVEKILKSLIENKLMSEKVARDFFVKGIAMVNPKIHTIRKDEKNRWKVGMMIDFFINARTKDMFRFAPKIPLKSYQRVFMTYMPQYGNGFEVSIDGRQLSDYEITQLAINDGFDCLFDFAEYFTQEMEDDKYSGKILHWTDFEY